MNYASCRGLLLNVLVYDVTYISLVPGWCYIGAIRLHSGVLTEKSGERDPVLVEPEVAVVIGVHAQLKTCAIKWVQVRDFLYGMQGLCIYLPFRTNKHIGN